MQNEGLAELEKGSRRELLLGEEGRGRLQRLLREGAVVLARGAGVQQSPREDITGTWFRLSPACDVQHLYILPRVPGRTCAL